MGSYTNADGYGMIPNQHKNTTLTQIKQLIRSKPITKKELLKEIGCTYNELNNQMYKLIKNSTITKNYSDGEWYYSFVKGKKKHEI